MYDAIGVLISLTILARAHRDHYKSIGAMLGLITYALALFGHFLFYRYGQETVYFSDFFQAPAAEQVFRFTVIIAVLTWIFNVMALIMCYVEVFDIRNSAQDLKRVVSHKTPSAARGEVQHHKPRERVSDYKNIDPNNHVNDHVAKEQAENQVGQTPSIEINDGKKQVRLRADQLQGGAMIPQPDANGADEPIDIVIEGLTLSQIAITETGIAIKPSASDSDQKASKTVTQQEGSTTKDNNDQTHDSHAGHGHNDYVAQVTEALFMGDSVHDKKAKRRTTRMKTAERHDKKTANITADMLDHPDDEE